MIYRIRAAISSHTYLGARDLPPVAGWSSQGKLASGDRLEGISKEIAWEDARKKALTKIFRTRLLGHH